MGRSTLVVDDVIEFLKNNWKWISLKSYIIDDINQAIVLRHAGCSESIEKWQGLLKFAEGYE